MSQFDYILDFIDQLRNAATPAEVCGRLLSFIVGLEPTAAIVEGMPPQRSGWSGGWLERKGAGHRPDRDPAAGKTGQRQRSIQCRKDCRSIGVEPDGDEDDIAAIGAPAGTAFPSVNFPGRTTTVSLGGEAVGLSATEFGLVSLAATCAIDRAMQLQSKQVQQSDRIDLTPRERECLQWAATGKSEWEISQILGISEHTSEKHLLNAKTKLGAVNRVQAVAEAIRRGYIS